MSRDHLVLLPHDPAWRQDFANERDRILSAATSVETIRVEHVGSTSIPTVHAKPILDIAILVTPSDLYELADSLTLLGYTYRGQNGDEIGHYYAVLDRENVRYCQIHIYTEADEDWQSKLAFRDALSHHAELAAEYDSYKRALAKQAASKSEYAAIKDRWMDDFLLKVLGSSANE